MATVKIVTDQDLGNSLEIENSKVEVKASNASGNLVEVRSDGVFAQEPTLGSMATEDAEDYLTKDEIESTYVKEDDLEADKFLANAELINDGKTLRMTLSDDSEVDVDLADLIPIKTGTGLKGKGTDSDPVQVDTSEVVMQGDIGSMAAESIEDYLAKTELTVNLETLGGSVIGRISE